MPDWQVTVTKVISLRAGGAIFAATDARGRPVQCVVRSMPAVPVAGEVWVVRGMETSSRLYGAQIRAHAAARDGEPFPGKMPDTLILDVRRKSPERFLKHRFGSVEASRGGCSLAVDGEVRADRTPDGHWVSCDWQGGGIGDNIALVRRLAGVGFREAVSLLAEDGDFPGPEGRPPAPVQPGGLQLPASCDGDAGEAYLIGRGISADAIRSAAACRALRFVRGAVLFVGYEDRGPASAPRSASLRSYAGSDPRPKRDLAGSSKAYPAVLAGDPARILVTEGGVSGLAAWDLGRAAWGRAPTVVITGGVGVRRWVETNAPLRQSLGEAAEVEVWAENEADAERQGATDVLRDCLAAAIGGARSGCLPEIVYPPPWAKDASDWLAGLSRSGASPLPHVPEPGADQDAVDI